MEEWISAKLLSLSYTHVYHIISNVAKRDEESFYNVIFSLKAS